MVFLLINWLFFLLSLFVGVEGLVDVLVLGGLESSWSSITMSWWDASSGVLTILSESDGSVFLRFVVDCFTCWLEPVIVTPSSMWWYWNDWVFGRVGDVYYWRYGWLVPFCWRWFDVNLSWFNCCSAKVDLIVFIVLMFIVLTCCAIMSSQVFTSIL